MADPGGGTGGTCPPPPFGQPRLSVASYIRVRVACEDGRRQLYMRTRVYITVYKPMASASSQLSPASFLLHQSAELPKNTPFRLTKTCSCRMIPWASKRGRLALKRRFVLQIPLESISEGLSFKIFLGGHAPRPPYFVRSARFLLLQATVCPPFSSFLDPPLYIILHTGRYIIQVPPY